MRVGKAPLWPGFSTLRGFGPPGYQAASSNGPGEQSCSVEELEFFARRVLYVEVRLDYPCVHAQIGVMMTDGHRAQQSVSQEISILTNLLGKLLAISHR